MRARFLASALSIPFLGIVVVLSLGDRSPGAVQRIWRRVRALGHRIELKFDTDVVDRSDIPYSYDTIGHFAMYAAAGALAWLILHERFPAWLIIVGVIVFSGLMEVAQPLLSTNRNMQVSDFMANSLGVVAGVATVAIGTRVLRLVTGERSRA